MKSTVVFTFIGPDRPGLVERLSEVAVAHEGNWLESRMVQLAGQFAGIARVELPAEQLSAFSDALGKLSAAGLTVTIQAGTSTEAAGELKSLCILGPDRPGIVREISRALSRRHINVKEMSSNVTSIAMSGEPLFEAHIDVEIPAGTTLDELFDQLDEIAEKLGVDIDTQDSN